MLNKRKEVNINFIVTKLFYGLKKITANCDLAHLDSYYPRIGGIADRGKAPFSLKGRNNRVERTGANKHFIIRTLL